MWTAQYQMPLNPNPEICNWRPKVSLLGKLKILIQIKSFKWAIKSPFAKYMLCVWEVWHKERRIKNSNGWHCWLERLDLEQQVCEWGNAGAQVETAFAAKLPPSNHHHINCSQNIIIWSRFCHLSTPSELSMLLCTQTTHSHPLFKFSLGLMQ